MALSGAQLEILKNAIAAAEQGAYTIEQIHFLAGGTISKDELTIVTEERVGPHGIRFRNADSYDVDGHTNQISSAELKD